MKIMNFVKKIINFDVEKKIRLRRAPSSGISLSGGQVSDGRLRRGLIVAAEHPQPPKFGVVNQISIGFRVQSGAHLVHSILHNLFLMKFDCLKHLFSCFL